jgi:CRP-like cAMP-binding protein
MRCLESMNDLYAGVSEEIRAELAQYEDNLIVPSGTKLVEEDVTPDHLTILSSGSAEISVRANGKDMPMGMAGAGRVFGLNSIISGDVPHVTVTCLQDCQIATLSGEAFKRVLQRHPEMYFAFAKVLGADLARADRFLRQNAEARKVRRGPRAARF